MAMLYISWRWIKRERNKSISSEVTSRRKYSQPVQCSWPFLSRLCWQKAYQPPNTRRTLSFSMKASFSTEYQALLLIENRLSRVRYKIIVGSRKRKGLCRKNIISPTPGDLRLSKLVIDIFLMSENIELVERRLSPKLIMFVTDSFRRSLCDLSGNAAFVCVPLALLAVALALDDGDVGDCSNGKDNDDLFITMPSSCSCCSSAIVEGWCLWLESKRFSLSSTPFD